MSEELNRQTAKKLTAQIVACPCEKWHQNIEDKIFTELQMSQERGEVVAKNRQNKLYDSILAFCMDDENMSDEQIRADLEAGYVDVDVFLERVNHAVDKYQKLIPNNTKEEL